MKAFIWLFALLVIACTTKQSNYPNADDALDAGREYINACLQGDFSKATFYTVSNEKSSEIIKKMEKIYREKDKEGRQQLRTASINIIEIKELTDSSTILYFSNSFDKTPDSIVISKQNKSWFVVLSKNN